jgi:hypothetical protein
LTLALLAGTTHDAVRATRRGADAAWSADRHRRSRLPQRGAYRIGQRLRVCERWRWRL